ncbi:MAG: hypothetical protein AB2814_09895 [Candidatus Sedimenticola endophacoides]
MSRHSGDCFAEATFRVGEGRYCSHWSQHRARMRADGELQTPKHELADAETGRVIESGLRGVAVRIETVTGMDFERFTRSMLLSQGGFAAFLQAAPDERAPILEQITGTEIYSRISIRVPARRAGSVAGATGTDGGHRAAQPGAGTGRPGGAGGCSGAGAGCR